MQRWLSPRSILLVLALVGLTAGVEAQSLPPQPFIRGDTNDDGEVSIADAVSLLGFLFDDGDLLCMDSGDVNDDEMLAISDPIYLLGYLFTPGSPLPPPPFPACGLDPAGGGLGCDFPLGSCPLPEPLTFAWPMPGLDTKDWVINNYVDLDPGPGLLDYMGGTKTYDGHRGIDIDVPNFRAMDNDFPILAAAPGVVVAFDDSHYDRNTTCSGSWNFVTVEHSNGWRSIYGHLKQNSVVVSVGQMVQTGDVLGVVGSSGCSTAPHLHFEVEDEVGNTIEPFQLGMWQAPPVYDTPLGFMDAAIYRQPVTNVDMIKDPPPNATVIQPGETLGIGLSMAGGEAGDVTNVRVLRPDGSILFSQNIVFNQVYRHSYWIVNYDLPAGGLPQGYYPLEIRTNGVLAKTYNLFFGPVYTGFHQVRHGLPLSQYQSTFDALVANGFRPVWFDGYVHNGTTYCNLIFHQSNGVPWGSAHGMTAAQYQTYFNDMTSQGFRLNHVESYLLGGSLRFQAIFDQSSGPAWVAYHGVTQAQHDVIFPDLAGQGYRVKNLSVENVGGNLYYTGLWDQQAVGGWIVLVGMTSAQYQTEFDNNIAAGRRLAYLNHFQVGTTPYFVAIWNSIQPNSWVARHNLTGAQFQTEFDTWTGAGLITRIVTGYQNGSVPNFGGYWTD